MPAQESTKAQVVELDATQTEVSERSQEAMAQVMLRALGSRPLSKDARRQAIEGLVRVLAQESLTQPVQGALHEILEILIHGS